MGQSIKGFKDGLNDASEDDDIVDVKKDTTAESKDDAKVS
jgi:Sec-independent protein translocase protein TatA